MHFTSYRGTGKELEEERKGYRKTRKYSVAPRRLKVVECRCGYRFKKQFLGHGLCDSCAHDLNEAMGDASP